MTEKKNVSFIFSGGRKDRINQDEIYAKDFFYGYFGFTEDEYNSKIIEFVHTKVFVVNFVDRIIKKLTNFPIAFSSLFNAPYKWQLKNSEIIFLVNESVMFYSLPLMYFYKKRKKDTKIILFTMGLFSNVSDNKLKNFIQKLLIEKICFKTLDALLFLGEGEYEYALKAYKNYSGKFHFVPFGIDTEFWKNESEYKHSDKDYILFIGNDLNRDYDFLNKLVRNMEDYNFVFLTSRLSEKDLNLKNVEIYDGMWWNNKLSDVAIKNLYKKAYLTIIPLNNTLQPSGQSVALQSMSLGTPVLITKTKGFWDKSKYYEDENIFFMNQNDVTLWRNKIISLLSSDKKLIEVSKNGKKLVSENFNLELFTTRIKKIVI
mgnify:CR=1 FL=1|jgi:glycosyltransferase involved in cell wall biosynthesis